MSFIRRTQRKRGGKEEGRKSNGWSGKDKTGAKEGKKQNFHLIALTEEYNLQEMKKIKKTT
jgi:hypothetical protein